MPVPAMPIIHPEVPLKTISFFFLFLVLCSSAAFAEEKQAGRYQLFQGHYTHWDQALANQNNEIFLLDTVTGEVKVYVSATLENGKQIKYWAPAVMDETKISPAGLSSASVSSS